MRSSIKYLFLLLLLSNFSIAQKKGQQTTTPTVEAKTPNWVSNRPHSGFKYVGIGVADKSRSDYKTEGKQNALFDLASEIKVDISTNSVLHSVSSNTSFDQSFNSMIKLTASENIEGYTMVDSYENDKQYWVYYELDKAEHAKRKEQKKQNTLTKAANLIALSFADEKNKNFSAALKKRIQAFGILNPYLNEEIVFDPTKSNGINNVFELTNLIQNQLQTITIVQPQVIPVVKPYQPNYNSIIFKVNTSNGAALNDFPFFLHSDDEYLKIEEHVATNSSGEIQLKINGVEPQFQLSSVTFNPDIEKLIANDSVGKTSITLLKQFIQTPALKVQVNIEPISIFIQSKESNFGKQLPTNMIEQFVQQKFTGQEIKIIDNIKASDYVIELEANTSDDISSDVLHKNFNLNLSLLTINVALKNTKGEVLYKNLVTDIFGYANSIEKAGINAYSNNKLKVRLSESLFFMKRKMIIY
jgi:hypothetical protein